MLSALARAVVELLEESLLVGLSISFPAATLTVACVVLRVQSELWLERTLPAVACVATPESDAHRTLNPHPLTNDY